MNPAALYIRQSDRHIAVSVPDVYPPVRDERGAIAAGLWGITTHTDVFALHMSLRALSEGREGMRFTPEMEDGLSISIRYSNGAAVAGKLGLRSAGGPVMVGVIESTITDRRIDVHVAVAPLPSPGDVCIRLAVDDGNKFGEWRISGDSILESSKTVIDFGQA